MNQGRDEARREDDAMMDQAALNDQADTQGATEDPNEVYSVEEYEALMETDTTQDQQDQSQRNANAGQAETEDVLNDI